MHTLIVFPLAATMLIAPSSKLQLVQAPAPQVNTFEQRWEPVREMPPMVDLTRKSDRIDPRLLEPRGEMAPRVIRTIPIGRENAVPPLSHEAVATPEKELEQRNSIQGDVPSVRPRARIIRTAAAPGFCERYGMHRVETNGGRSWRCRK